MTLTGMMRWEVASGMVTLAFMFPAMAAAAPRRGCSSSPRRTIGNWSLGRAGDGLQSGGLRWSGGGLRCAVGVEKRLPFFGTDVGAW